MYIKRIERELDHLLKGVPNEGDVLVEFGLGLGNLSRSAMTVSLRISHDLADVIEVELRTDEGKLFLPPELLDGLTTAWAALRE
jgi:hypothetical protein